MKNSKMLLLALAISLGCCGCDGDATQTSLDKPCEENGSCSTDEPVTDEPVTDEPVTDEPVTDNPSTDNPGNNGEENPNADCSKTCTPKDKKCVDNAVMECIVNDETQCTEWGAVETCSNGTHCDENQLKCIDACSEICDGQKQTKCGPEGVMKCEPDSAGCAVWNVVEKCDAGARCDENSLKCVRKCSEKCDASNAKKCEGGKLVSCTSDAFGCASFSTSDCNAGTYCDEEKADCVACKETCTTSKRCSNSGVESCQPDANGCAVWTLTTKCKSNQTCDKDKLACIDACNPACGSGLVCVNNACKCDETLPNGWPETLTALPYPLMTPTKTSSFHGADNIYAPDIHEVSGKKVMWYGAQGGDGHDRIYMAWSNDGAEWRKYPSDSSPKPVLEHGGSNHVNDPSLVHVGNVWKMYYTDARTGEDDRIWLAESKNLTDFKKVQLVVDVGAPGSWEPAKVGRPAVIYENGIYKMWYDGQGKDGRHVGYATSTDGIHFKKYEGNPVMRNAGAIDVKKVGGVYVMLHEGGSGTYWATSIDGLCWVNRGKLFGLSGASYDRYGQVTPFIEVVNDKLQAVWFGGASVESWNKNRIGAAYAPGKAPSGGGCTACAGTGLTCTEACQRAGAGKAGYCANPGSTTAGACCACKKDGCEQCVGSSADCQAACVSNGHSGGYCAHPGSTEPGKCCACLD